MASGAGWKTCSLGLTYPPVTVGYHNKNTLTEYLLHCRQQESLRVIAVPSLLDGWERCFCSPLENLRVGKMTQNPSCKIIKALDPQATGAAHFVCRRPPRQVCPSGTMSQGWPFRSVLLYRLQRNTQCFICITALLSWHPAHVQCCSAHNFPAAWDCDRQATVEEPTTACQHHRTIGTHHRARRIRKAIKSAPSPKDAALTFRLGEGEDTGGPLDTHFATPSARVTAPAQQLPHQTAFLSGTTPFHGSCHRV